MEYKNAYLQIVEEEYLSRYAQHVKDTKGRLKPIEPCPLRTEYQRDRDRIIHCKAFRRLKHKTQVFLSPEGDHYRTRLTHTLEVAQIARTMARALRLNEDLTEAISLGHDLGHTPFGHAGEGVLDKLIEGGFIHSRHSLRVVDLLEGDGDFLTIPVNNMICASYLADILGEMDAEHNDLYQQNVAAYVEAMSALDLRMREVAAQLEDAKIFCEDGSMAYFAREYGLELSDGEEEAVVLHTYIRPAEEDEEVPYLQLMERNLAALEAGI